MNFRDMNYSKQKQVAIEFLKIIGLDMTMNDFGHKWALNNFYNDKTYYYRDNNLDEHRLNPEFYIELADYSDPELKEYRTKYLIGKNESGKTTCIEVGKFKFIEGNFQKGSTLSYKIKDFSEEFNKSIKTAIQSTNETTQIK